MITVLDLEAMVLPALEATLVRMIRDGVPDPVRTLHRLQAGGEDAVSLRYGRVFRQCRGLYGIHDNAAVLEQSMRQAIDLLGALR